MKRLWRHLPEIGIGALTAALAGTVAIVAITAVSRLEQANSHSVASTTAHMADLIAARFGETVNAIDNLQQLGALVSGDSDDHHETGVTTALSALRHAAEKPGSVIPHVTAVSPEGGFMWSTAQMSANPPNLSDRDYVRAIVADRLDRFVGVPRAGALTGQPVIPFAMAVRDAAHKLRFIVVVAVNTQNLKPLAAGLGMGPKDMISLYRGDGIALARSQDIAVGLPAPDPGLFKRLSPDGTLDEIGIGQIYYEKRFLSIRRIPDSNLYLAFSRNAESALAPGKLAVTEIKRSAGMIGVTIAVSGILLIILLHRRRKFQEMQFRLHDISVREDMLRQVTAGAPEIIGMQDENRRWIYINGAVHDIFGGGPERWIGQKAGVNATPEDKKLITDAYDAVDQGSGPRRVEVRAKKADGTLIWIEALISSLVLNMPAGEPVRRYLAILRDITNRKQAEEALRDARGEAAALLVHTPGILYKSKVFPDGTRQAMVAHGASRFGFTDTMMTAPDFMKSRLSAEDFRKREAAVAQCLREGRSVVEFALRIGNGESRWLRDAMSRGAPDAGVPVLVGFISDITEEHDRQQRQQQTERLASLSTVATGIAHEMNQPLAAIIMSAENGIELLKQPALGPARVAAKFERIIEQANRISEVVTHVRLVGTSMNSGEGSFTLTEALDGVMLLVGERLKAEDTVVVRDIGSGLPAIPGSRILFELVLMNLVMNAADAYAAISPPSAHRREIAVRASCTRGRLNIRVADRAGGIAPEVMGKIFDPFFTTRPGKSMGLGLSIVFTTISEAGGRVAVSNEEGGAVFEIDLPVSRRRQ